MFPKALAVAGLLAVLLLPVRASGADDLIRPKVVVLTTFGVPGSEDRGGEVEPWLEHEHLTKTVDLPGVDQPLRSNDAGVFVMVTGTCNRSGVALMELGLDPRFDLAHTYWIVAGIAGADANKTSVGSAAWARWVVDADNANEVDDHDAPKGWPYGILPYGSRFPDDPPGARDWSQKPMAFEMNPQLVDWAYALTKDVPLKDTPGIRKFRAAYAGQPLAQRPPSVLIGDSLGTARYWHGPTLTRWAERWVSMYTGGRGNFVMTDDEDQSICYAYYVLAKAGRVNARRLLVLRTASNYSAPPIGGEVVSSLLAGESEGTGVAADSAYRVAAPVVHELASHWGRYRDTTPGD